MARTKWTDESRNYLPIRTEAQLKAAAADGDRRWKIARRDWKNARTQDEEDAATALIRQIVADEDSGKIPLLDSEDSFPPLPDLPTHPDDVIAVIVEPNEKDKRR